MLADQPQILATLDGIRAHPSLVAGVLIVGATPDEEAELLTQLPIGVTHVSVSPRSAPDARAKLPGYIELEFHHAPATGTPLAKAFLHAIATANLAHALALAESAGNTIELVDQAIAAVAEHLRTNQAPRQTVAALRALWEVRYRLSMTDVPASAALPSLVAEIANVMADLEQATKAKPTEEPQALDSAQAQALLKGNP